MAMNVEYLNVTANAGAAAVTHLGLVDDTGTEIAGGSYQRRPVTWTTASDGLIRPDADRSFNIPAGATVAGWRGFNAASGGTNYGGQALPEQPFTTAGTYVLRASQTFIDHDAGTGS